MNRVEGVRDINYYLAIPEESHFLEFKRLDGKKVVSKIIETIVAFANTDGGQIIVGIDDPEKSTKKGLDRIYGIEENQENYDEIFRGQAKISPIINIESEQLYVGEIDKTIAVIRVPKAINGLHSFNGRVFVRLNKGNKELIADEITNWSYARGFRKADEELVDVDLSLLDTKYYMEWKSNRNIVGGIKEVLEKTGLARRGKPTRAALMLFAEYPTGHTETKCAIKIMAYKGNTIEYGETPNMIGLPKIIDAPLIEQIRLAQEYVLELLKAGLSIEDGFYTKYLIPERAVKEAITNAVIHRDYNIKRDIEIKIFEDRIEIISPGLFPYNINKNNIGLERSARYRNDLIVKTLRDFPNPPNLDQNEGVVAMRKEMETRGLYPPQFRTYPDTVDTVDVILSNEHTQSEWDKLKIYLQSNTYVTNTEARAVTGVKQMYTMSRLFSKWVRQGLLIRVNSGAGTRTAKYKLADDEES